MDHPFKRPTWAPRVSRYEIAKLYHTDARGIRDETLADEVGYGLFVRAEDCLTVTGAMRGEVKCPECGAQIARNRPKLRKQAAEEMLSCPSCEWRLPWTEYHKSYRNKHLGAAGMEPYLREPLSEGWKPVYALPRIGQGSNS